MNLVPEQLREIGIKGQLSKVMAILYEFCLLDVERYRRHRSMMGGESASAYQMDALRYVMKRLRGANAKLVAEWIEWEIGLQC